MKFTILAVSFITAIVTNGLAIFLYNFIDREKYTKAKWSLRQVLLLNILIFILLLPVYLIVITTRETLLTIAMLQILLSAQASIFALEISAARDSSDTFLALYGITFSTLVTVVISVIVFVFGGSTAALMAILPIIWLSIGIILHATEMIYSWVYRTFGTEFLREPSV